MHHSLRLYTRFQQPFLKMYIFLARWTGIPLIGRLVRMVANNYGSRVSGGFLLTTEEAGLIVDKAEGLALGPCACRKAFKNCDGPVKAEIMIGINRNIFMEAHPGEFEEITRQEARDILKQSHEKGLIHTIVKCGQEFYAICNCCTCCCVPLRLNKRYGIGSALLRRDDIVGLVTGGQPLQTAPVSDG